MFYVFTYVKESEMIHHQPVFEYMLLKANSLKLHGASAFKGIMGFGDHHRIHTMKIIDLSSDIPVKLEIIDQKEKILSFINVIKKELPEITFYGYEIMTDNEF